MYKHILFDLDGTLTDPAIGITNSVAYALEKFDIIVDDKRTLYKFIGPPLVDSFKEFYGFDEQKALLAVEYYREYFSVTGIFENSVYDGIEDLLSKLRNNGLSVILATSKPEIFAQRILEHFKLEKYFDIIAGSTLDTSRNTKSAVIKYALEQSNITDCTSAIMVGDRKHDIIGAKENGLSSIGVLYGYGDYNELNSVGADYIIKDVISLEKLLLDLLEKEF